MSTPILDAIRAIDKEAEPLALQLKASIKVTLPESTYGQLLHEALQFPDGVKAHVPRLTIGNVIVTKGEPPA